MYAIAGTSCSGISEVVDVVEVTGEIRGKHDSGSTGM